MVEAFEIAVGRCVSIEKVATLFKQAIAPLGFDASAVGGFQVTDNGPAPLFFFQDWPPGWVAIYTERNFVASDFIVAEARGRLNPFTFQEAISRRAPDHPGNAVWKAARDWGWKDGYAVPIHGPAGYFGLVSMASTCGFNVEASLLKLRMLAILAHERCFLLARNDEHAELPAHLTDRELECLRWVAAGKTDSEISSIMGIGVTTVRSHVESARKKLKATTRAQAVTRLLLGGSV